MSMDTVEPRGIQVHQMASGNARFPSGNHMDIAVGADTPMNAMPHPSMARLKNNIAALSVSAPMSEPTPDTSDRDEDCGLLTHLAAHPSGRDGEEHAAYRQ